MDRRRMRGGSREYPGARIHEDCVSAVYSRSQPIHGSRRAVAARALALPTDSRQLLAHYHFGDGASAFAPWAELDASCYRDEQTRSRWLRRALVRQRCAQALHGGAGGLRARARRTHAAEELLLTSSDRGARGVQSRVDAPIAGAQGPPLDRLPLCRCACSHANLKLIECRSRTQPHISHSLDRGSLSLPSHVAHAPKAVGALRLREPGFLTRSSHAFSLRHW